MDALVDARIAAANCSELDRAAWGSCLRLCTQTLGLGWASWAWQLVHCELGHDALGALVKRTCLYYSPICYAAVTQCVSTLEQLAHTCERSNGAQSRDCLSVPRASLNVSKGFGESEAGKLPKSVSGKFHEHSGRYYPAQQR